MVFIWQEEVNTVVSTNTHAKADYNVATYKVLSDAGDEVEDAGNFVSSSHIYF